MTQLKALRQKRNLTQAELARLIGVKRTTVTQWENGVNRPRTSMIPILANTLRCPVNTLIRAIT